VEHHISTARPPIAAKFLRLDSVKLAAAKKEFLQMEKDSIVQGQTVQAVTSSYGDESGWQLAALQQLLVAKPGNYHGFVPTS
jgi:hypothetical protein